MEKASADASATALNDNKNEAPQRYGTRLNSTNGYALAKVPENKSRVADTSTHHRPVRIHQSARNTGDKGHSCRIRQGLEIRQTVAVKVKAA